MKTCPVGGYLIIVLNLKSFSECLVDVFEVKYGSLSKASDDLKTSDDALETLYDLITKYTNFHEWCFKLFEVNMEYTPPQTLRGFTLSVTKSKRKVQGNNV